MKVKMRCSAFLFAGLVSLCSAQGTTTIFLPGFDQQALFVSVVGSDSTATTYAVGCGNTDECGVPEGFTFTQGPSTMHYSISSSNAFVDLGCSLAGMTSAVCSATENNSDHLRTITTTTISGTELAGYFVPATVTDKIPAATDATTTGDSPASTGSADSQSAEIRSSALATSTTATSTSTVSKTSAALASTSGSVTGVISASSTKVSTARAPQITGNTPWALNGMVAVAIAVAGL